MNGFRNTTDRVTVRASAASDALLRGSMWTAVRTASEAEAPSNDMGRHTLHCSGRRQGCSILKASHKMFETSHLGKANPICAICKTTGKYHMYVLTTGKYWRQHYCYAGGS